MPNHQCISNILITLAFAQIMPPSSLDQNRSKRNFSSKIIGLSSLIYEFIAIFHEVGKNSEVGMTTVFSHSKNICSTASLLQNLSSLLDIPFAGSDFWIDKFNSRSHGCGCHYKQSECDGIKICSVRYIEVPKITR